MKNNTDIQKEVILTNGQTCFKVIMKLLWKTFIFPDSVEIIKMTNFKF